MKDDLIRRGDALEALNKQHPLTKSVMRRVVMQVPAVDAVEVVRCLYCIHAEMDDPDFTDDYYCHAGCGWNKADFFCAYAERREDDAHLE